MHITTRFINTPTHMFTMKSQTRSFLTFLTLILITPSSSSSSTKALRINLNFINRSFAQASVHANSNVFIAELAIGTPPVPFHAVLDTSSDMIWTQCQPCKLCFQQSTQIFHPRNSSSFAELPCSSDLCGRGTTSYCHDNICHYSHSYGEYPLTQGVLATDTLTFGDVSFPNITFGCGDDNTWGSSPPASGYLGLGRGTTSIVSQLGLRMFSYCFTTFGQYKKGTLFLGVQTNLSKGAKGPMQTMPLFRNPEKPSYYYLSLLGISVGRKHIPVRKADKKNGVGAVIVDSGSSMTRLESALYVPVMNAFESQVKLPVAPSQGAGDNLCFRMGNLTMAEVEVPELVFHFDGGDMEFPVMSYMAVDTVQGLLCLMMAAEYSVSILGSYQQQGMHLLFDLREEKLSFVYADCTQV